MRHRNVTIMTHTETNRHAHALRLNAARRTKRITAAACAAASRNGNYELVAALIPQYIAQRNAMNDMRQYRGTNESRSGRILWV